MSGTAKGAAGPVPTCDWNCGIARPCSARAPGSMRPRSRGPVAVSGSGWRPPPTGHVTVWSRTVRGGGSPLHHGTVWERVTVVGKVRRPHVWPPGVAAVYSAAHLCTRAWAVGRRELERRPRVFGVWPARPVSGWGQQANAAPNRFGRRLTGAGQGPMPTMTTGGGHLSGSLPHSSPSRPHSAGTFSRRTRTDSTGHAEERSWLA